MKTIAQKVRERRKQAGIPAYVLAKRARTSPHTITLLEVWNMLPNRSVCERIAQALCTTYEELFADEELFAEQEEVSAR